MAQLRRRAGFTRSAPWAGTAVRDRNYFNCHLSNCRFIDGGHIAKKLSFPKALLDDIFYSSNATIVKLVTPTQFSLLVMCFLNHIATKFYMKFRGLPRNTPDPGQMWASGQNSPNQTELSRGRQNYDITAPRRILLFELGSHRGKLSLSGRKVVVWRIPNEATRSGHRDTVSLPGSSKLTDFADHIHAQWTGGGWSGRAWGRH